MRTLSAALKAAQESELLDPKIKVTFSKTAESDIVVEEDIILQMPTEDETTDSQTCEIVFDNSDGYFTTLDLKGWTAVVQIGLPAPVTVSYTTLPPFKVLSQDLSSGPGRLQCRFSLIGIPNRLAEDKASTDYFHHWSSTKTVKDLITEVASGVAVPGELTERQDTYDSYSRLGSYDVGTTDLAGAIKTETAVGNTTVALKSLGTGTINKDTVLSINGDSTEYIVTADATITTNEATVTITPAIAKVSAVDTLINLNWRWGTGQTGSIAGVGQKLYIKNTDDTARTVSKISFCLKKVGSPTGNITFRIDYVDDESTAATKVLADASTLTTSPVWYEATLASPVAISATREAYVWCEYTDGDATNYVNIAYSLVPVKANENGVNIAAAGPDYIKEHDFDCAYRYKYAGTGINCFTHCEAYEVVYDPFGTHTGGTHATIMTDAVAAFTVDALIGLTIYNGTDGSYGTITDNNATTVTVSALSGGTDNQWEVNDTYIVADSLLDIYVPADAFRVYEGGSRLDAINNLLQYTGCEKRVEDDGKLHVFVPVTTGTTYDSEYSLDTGHFFFSKSIRNALVMPNRIVVHSYKDDDAQYTGEAKDASYVDADKSTHYDTFVRAKLTSDAQATSIATAMLARLQIASQRGHATVPINLGSEVYDYVLVTDSSENDTRVGNLGYIHRSYNPRTTWPDCWKMGFSFGRVGGRGVSGTRPSDLIEDGVETPISDKVITFGETVRELVPYFKGVEEGKRKIWGAEVYEGSDVTINGEKVDPSISGLWKQLIKLANIVASLEDTISTVPMTREALIGYLKNIVEDTAPKLGGTLDCNSNQITGASVISNGAGAIYQTAGSVNHEWKTDGSLDMGTEQIHSVVDPTANQDAATKKYVDDNAYSGKKVNSGTFNGNDADDRAIAHGLGLVPRLVIIVATAGEAAGYVLGSWNINNLINAVSSVTTATTTNFYVNNSDVFFNNTGTTYNWVAISS